MHLYGSILSPYVRKARVLIIEKGINCDFIVHDPWAPDSKVPSLSPIGKVPVLEIAPGKYLSESGVVMRYLDELTQPSLCPEDKDAFWQSQWWQTQGNGVIDATVARVMETRRPADKQMPEKMQREEARIARVLEAMEQAHTGSPWLVGATFSLADLVAGVAMQYLDIRYPHDWRRTYPRLYRWFEPIAARPSFEDTLPPGFVKP